MIFEVTFENQGCATRNIKLPRHRKVRGSFFCAKTRCFRGTAANNPVRIQRKRRLYSCRTFLPYQPCRPEASDTMTIGQSTQNSARRVHHHARQYHTGLFMITSICGLIDAVCFLALGGVFAEMMTGNLLLLALTLGTGAYFSDAGHYITAITAFTFGALAGGYTVNTARQRGHYQRAGYVVEWLVLVCACVLALNSEPQPDNWAGITLVILLAFAMGIQNAIVRSYGVPDLATNVMTLTYTAIFAESKPVRGTNHHWQRRVGSVLLFFISAVVGALLLRIGMVAPLVLATLIFTLALYPLLFGHREPAP